MQVVGRYALFDEIAHGGMATVHLGRLLGQGGFSRTVAVKRLHPHLARDPEFVTMLLDEARLVGRIQHPHVVQMLDVVATAGELMIVMEHIQGESLVRLVRLTAQRGERIPPAIASAVLVNVLRGLHAAHEVRGESGELLGLVHRDVTPHNIMVRKDGTALMLDFGVAKAAGRFHTTEEGKIKGKLPYMAPEQLRGQPATRRTDIYAAGAVLWETLVGARLFRGEHEGELLERVLLGEVRPPSAEVDGLPEALDAAVMRALERDPALRFATAAEMADALEAALPPALASQVAAWLEDRVGPAIERQAARVLEIESGSHLSFEGLPDDVAQLLVAGSARADRGANAAAAVEPGGEAGDEAATRSGSIALPTQASAPARSGPPLLPADPVNANPAAPAVDPVNATTASVVSAATAASARSSRLRWIALGVLVVLAPAAWFVARGRSGAGLERASPAEPAGASVPTPTAGIPVADSGASSTAVAASAMASSATPSTDGAATATPAPAAPAVAPSGGRPVGPRPSATPAPKPSPSDCVKIDAQGHRTYDRRCLQ